MSTFVLGKGSVPGKERRTGGAPKSSTLDFSLRPIAREENLAPLWPVFLGRQRSTKPTITTSKGMTMTAKLTGSRVTIRLTEEDERAIRSLTTLRLPMFSLVNKSDIVRAALQEAAAAAAAKQEAERALAAELASRR